MAVLFQIRFEIFGMVVPDETSFPFRTQTGNETACDQVLVHIVSARTNQNRKPDQVLTARTRPYSPGPCSTR